jgi:hypothetical protein
MWCKRASSPRGPGRSTGDRQFHRLQSFEEKCSGVALRCSRRSRPGQGLSPRFHWVENFKIFEPSGFQNHNRSKVHVIAGTGRVSGYAGSCPPAGPGRLSTIYIAPQVVSAVEQNQAGRSFLVVPMDLPQGAFLDDFNFWNGSDGAGLCHGVLRIKVTRREQSGGACLNGC